MQNICYNSAMNWWRRHLMRLFKAAMFFAVAMPHGSCAYCLVHGQLTNEVQNGVAIARTYDSLNRPTGYSLNEEGSLRSLRSLRLEYSYDTLGHFSGVVFNVEAQKGRVDSTFSLLEYAPHIHSIRLICPPSSFNDIDFSGSSSDTSRIVNAA